MTEVIASIAKNRRERVRVALDTWQGVDLVDIRVTVDLTESSGIQTPTKKGLNLNVAKLPELISALQAAQTRACDLGLLPAQGGNS